MERLTHIDHLGWYANGRDGERIRGSHIDRLAAYEDTGLEPEAVNAIKHSLMGKSIAEIKEFEGIPIQRLRELAQAEQDGRLVVLPCKVGDAVYVTDLTDGQIEECEVACFSCIDGMGGGLIEYNAPPDYPRIVSVECGLDEICKTVFLTREEAEAALKHQLPGDTSTDTSTDSWLAYRQKQEEGTV